MAGGAVAAIGFSTPAAQERLPWILAMPLIGGVSFALWIGIWSCARLVLIG
jgi:hypothetical protein